MLDGSLSGLDAKLGGCCVDVFTTTLFDTTACVAPVSIMTLRDLMINDP
jgi:hypothetical protein